MFTGCSPGLNQGSSARQRERTSKPRQIIIAPTVLPNAVGYYMRVKSLKSISSIDCLPMAPELAGARVPTRRNHLASMATHLGYTCVRERVKVGAPAVRAE